MTGASIALGAVSQYKVCHPNKSSNEPELT